MMNKTFLADKPDNYVEIPKHATGILDQHTVNSSKWTWRGIGYGIALLNQDPVGDSLIKFAVKKNRRWNSPQSYLWRYCAKLESKIRALKEELLELERISNESC